MLRRAVLAAGLCAVGWRAPAEDDRLRLAAEAGELEAQYVLGRDLAVGRGRGQDLVQALAWLELAAWRAPVGHALRFIAETDIAALRPQMQPEQIDEAARLSASLRARFP